MRLWPLAAAAVSEPLRQLRTLRQWSPRRRSAPWQHLLDGVWLFGATASIDPYGIAGCSAHLPSLEGSQPSPEVVRCLVGLVLVSAKPPIVFSFQQQI